MSPSDQFQLMWGPGACGFILSAALFGCTLGQCIFYFRSFVQDLKSLKATVTLLLMMDTVHTYFMAGLYWKFLVACHGVVTLDCPSQLPWEMMAAMFVSYIVTTMVQCFYAHRVWIISARNILLAGLITTTTLVQFALGLICTWEALITRSAVVLYSTPWSPRSALLGAICDILITGSVFFYLREGRREVRRSQNYFRILTIVFINMGLFTCVVSVIWCLLYIIQGGNYFTALPTGFICKSYANSMMAVLNARKSVRDREQELVANGYDLTTIDVFHNTPRS